MSDEIDPGRRHRPRTSRHEPRIEHDNAAKGRAARRDMRHEPDAEGSIRS